MCAASLEGPRSGLAGATTVKPRCWRRLVTAANPEASANAPWTSTMVGWGPVRARASAARGMRLRQVAARAAAVSRTAARRRPAGTTYRRGMGLLGGVGERAAPRVETGAARHGQARQAVWGA